jgi:GDPmannose 4,6-dehydratase
VPRKKKALITGVTGQDGSYLAEHLLDLDYEVHGVVRRVALEDPPRRLRRIAHLHDRLHLHSGSIESYPSLLQIVHQIQPDEVYHLAAQSFVAESFDDSFSTMSININGTHYVLAAIRMMAPHAKLYFAGTSEMFGRAVEVPQTETTPFRPRSPYGISKLTGYELVRNYREAYGMYACSGILFNHESPRRGYEFVTRKTTAAIARIKRGEERELVLGNLDAKRDWGHAKDYVRAMHLMLQRPAPRDYVIASGETHSVREFVDKAFACAGLDYHDYVRTSAVFFRPTEIEQLIGDASTARRELGWQPQYTFDELVAEMVREELEATAVNGNAAAAGPPYHRPTVTLGRQVRPAAVGRKQTRAAASPE